MFVGVQRTCNNIAWNTGPLTAHQFRMAWERYQWNKVQSKYSNTSLPPSISSPLSLPPSALPPLPVPLQPIIYPCLVHSEVRSIVPMIHLTWNLARSVRLTDSHFYSQVRYTPQPNILFTKVCPDSPGPVLKVTTGELSGPD